MKLSTKGRYAVMAMADIALHTTGRPVPLGDVASRQGISQEYLEQLFAKLPRSYRRLTSRCRLPVARVMQSMVVSKAKNASPTSCGRHLAARSSASCPRSRWAT